MVGVYEKAPGRREVRSHSHKRPPELKEGISGVYEGTPGFSYITSAKPPRGQTA
jgi:hypothetical protein